MPSYLLSTPPIVVGANKLLLDLFNAPGSGTGISVQALWIIPKTDVAVTGLVGVRGDVYRTNTVGTGGTPAVRDTAASVAPDPAGGSFAKTDEGSIDLPAGITARVAPAGGAAISRWLRPWVVNPEETNPAAFLAPSINWLGHLGDSNDRGLAVDEGTGLLIKQNAVASVGAVSIVIAFRI